jgi:hypothetical protein
VVLAAMQGFQFRATPAGGTSTPWQDSPVFTGLIPNFGYAFAAKMLETDTTNEGAASEALGLTTQMAKLTGTPTLTSTGALDAPQSGDVLTATVSLGTKPTDPSGVQSPQYQWYRGSSPISGATSLTYTIVPEDQNRTLHIEATAANTLGKVASANTGTVGRTPLVAPSAPTELATTANSVTLTAIAGAEYAFASTNAVPDDWQASTVFANLVPNTQYWFFARLAETEANGASPASAGTAITTDRATLTGTPSIVGNPVFGNILTASVSGLSASPSSGLGTYIYQWYRGSSLISDAKAATYTLTADDVGQTLKVSVSTSNTQGTLTSAVTATITKAPGIVPNAPTVASATSTSITLVQAAGTEYAKSATTTPPTTGWQSSGAFSGLTPQTTYYFFARGAETAGRFASAASYPTSALTQVMPSVPTLVGTPTLAGASNPPKVGDILTVNVSSLTSDPQGTSIGTLSYQWLRGGVAITGANSATYTIAETDVGSALSVVVSSSTLLGEQSSTELPQVAKQPAPAALPAPTVASHTASSVELAEVPGAEYSKDGTTWQISPLFDGLLPNTAYNFYQRKAETSTTLVGAASPATPQTTDQATLAGSIGIVGLPAVGATLVPIIADHGVPNLTGGLGERSFQWRRDGVAIAGATSETYIVTAADMGYTLSVVMQRANCVGALESKQVSPVKAAYTGATPTAPVVASDTTTSITLTAVAGQEYARSAKGGGALDESTWQAGGVFTDLTPGSTYTFYTRVAATAGTSFSANSPGTEATTDKLARKAPTAPIIALVDLNGFVVSAIAGGEYSIDGTTWQASTDFLNLAPLTEYSVYQRYAETATYLTSPASAATKVTTQKSGSTAPLSPVVASHTATTVSLHPIAGAEYAWEPDNTPPISDDDWQSDTLFVGLEPSTQYYFFARYAETDLAEASDASDGVSVTTDPAEVSGSIAFEGTGTVGSTLTVNDDNATITADGEPLGTRDILEAQYQWYLDGVPILGATGPSHQIVQADLGHTLSVKVTYPGVSGELTKTMRLSEPTNTEVETAEVAQNACAAETAQIRIEPADPLATVIYGTQSLKGGGLFTTRSLNEGMDTIVYVIEAQDGTKTPHTLAVERSVELADLTVLLQGKARAVKSSHNGSTVTNWKWFRNGEEFSTANYVNIADGATYTLEVELTDPETQATQTLHSCNPAVAALPKAASNLPKQYYDIHGNLVGTSLSVRSLKPGIYFVRQGSTSQTIVVK